MNQKQENCFQPELVYFDNRLAEWFVFQIYAASGQYSRFPRSQVFTFEFKIIAFVEKKKIDGEKDSEKIY